jgi:predicted Zn-dependent protease
MAPKGKKKPVAKKSSAAGTVHTAQKLVEQGNIALGNMELELAEQFFSRALGMEPNDTDIMDALADVQIQIGDTESAKNLLLRSTAAAPQQNPYKWLFLGQLQNNMEAVHSYQRGITALGYLAAAEQNVK